jgi:hypothetical protein
MTIQRGGFRVAITDFETEIDADIDSEHENGTDAENDTDLDAEFDAPTSAFEVETGGGGNLGIEKLDIQTARGAGALEEVEDSLDLDLVENILDLPDTGYPRFTLAKNKARFLRMLSWYRAKEEWIEVAPLSGVTKLFKQQTKELEGIRSSKLDYEMELETGTLTPSQRSYRKDELKMCRVQEKMAVHLISKLQVKIKSGRR